MAGEQRWLFTKEELANTPSRKAGIDAEKELNYRQQCANLVQDMGQKLQVTQLCINTAIVYMHRFYMFHSFSKFHRNPMGAACLFLAAKVEEQPRKLEHVIRSYHFCVNREQGSLDVKSEAYLELAQECVINENILLQTLGFSISVEHPHAKVVKTCTLVKASKDLAQTSYFLATNSLHLTTMCLKYSHTVVSCVCIHLACKWSNYQIPRSTEGKEWYEYVDKNITKEMLDNLTQEFLQILDNCPSKLKKKILTWKSGSKSIDEQSNPGGERAGNEATHSPQHAIRHPAPGTSESSEANQLRRVRTEPAIAHKEYLERKRKEQARMQHKQGYHPGQGPAVAGGGGGGGGPTHPPPGSRPTHPPPSRRPPTASVPTHPPPSAAGHSHHRPGEDSKTAAPHPADRRSNIFDQMQQERGQMAAGGDQAHGGERTRAPGQGHAGHGHHHGSHTDNSMTSQGHTLPQGHHQSGQGHHATGHHSQGHTSSSHHGTHVRDKANQVLGKPKSDHRESHKPISSNHPPSTASNKPPSSYSKFSQDNSEKSMLEKLNSEILNQSARSKHKDGSSTQKRQSPEKGLRSPPAVKRQKSNSSGSRSGSDGTTPKKEDNVRDRIRAVTEIKEKMMQEDRKRLRRASEELGDDKLREKPVVVLDNVFTSPENAGVLSSPEKTVVTPEKAKSSVSPGDASVKLEFPTNKQSSHDQADSDAFSNSHMTRTVVDTHAHPKHAGSIGHAHKEVSRNSASISKDAVPDASFSATKTSTSVHQATDNPSLVHSLKSRPAGHSQKHGEKDSHHHKNLAKGQDPSKIASGSSKHGARKEHVDSQSKRQSSSSASHLQKKEQHHSGVKVEHQSESSHNRHSISKDISATLKRAPHEHIDIKTDVGELLKSIGRKEEPMSSGDKSHDTHPIKPKEDFYRIGPPREIKKESVDVASSDTLTGQDGTDEAKKEGKDKEGLNRSRSTISLEKYRQRKPITPSQENKASPSTVNKVDPNVNTNATLTNKESESSLGFMYKSNNGDSKSDLGLSNDPSKSFSKAIPALNDLLHPAVSRTPSDSPLAEFSIGSPAKNMHSEEKKHLHDDAKTLMRSKQEKLDKLTARIEKPPERGTKLDKSAEKSAHSVHDDDHPKSIDAIIRDLNKPPERPKPNPAHHNVTKVIPSESGLKSTSHVTRGHSTSRTEKSNSIPKPETNSKPTIEVIPEVSKAEVEKPPESPSVEPGEIVDDTTGTESPIVKPVGLKIKLGGQVMVSSLSPKPDDVMSSSSLGSHHHHKEKHKKHKKHKHKSHDREKDRDREKSERRHHHHRKDSEQSRGLGDSGSSSDLKVKLNLKHLHRGSDSPHLPSTSSIVNNKDGPPSNDNNGSSVATSISTQPSFHGDAPPPKPMKLVLSKDKSGQYSSGHKHKSDKHDKSRKRTHSPADSERASNLGSAPYSSAGPLAKMPRSDVMNPSGSIGSNGNGSKPASPHGDLLEKTRQQSTSLERILQNQRKLMGKLKDKSSSSGRSKNKSPVRLPASYQNPNME